MFFPNDIWKIIKSYTFNYQKYIKKLYKKTLEEFKNKNNYWDYNGCNCGFWYNNNVGFIVKNTKLYSLERVELLCHFYNSGQRTTNPYEGWGFGHPIPIQSENYKLPIFWFDIKSGKHPYFIYK
jgi:hypothetical protein